MTPNSSIYSYYQQLRDKYEKTGQLFEDEDFPCDQSISVQKEKIQMENLK